ncbi:hypothetical protein [Spiroplasma endosymbiont of Polydrusus formosus]|uniref:hypothetical protein n=1 Tax=Spiroplasma endosymbiont of Polydrusus formosus TaxID=3139326 RepID=UPI0035B51EDA
MRANFPIVYNKVSLLARFVKSKINLSDKIFLPLTCPTTSSKLLEVMTPNFSSSLVSLANFKILVVRAARVNFPTPPIAGNKFKAVLFLLLLRKLNCLYINNLIYREIICYFYSKWDKGCGKIR